MKTRLSFVANFARIAYVALFLMLFSLVHSAAYGQGKKWAVLVGINKYENDAMSSLTYSVPDVQAVAKRLSALGFTESQLFVMTSDLPASSANHPTHTNIIKRLDRLAKLIEPDDTLLFYFSGHGFQRENGQHFLATVNADPDSIFTLQNSTLSVAILQEMMKRIKARQVVFILDACREEPEKGAKGDPDNKLTSDFSKRILLVTEGSGAGAAGSGTLFACSEGQRSWEWAAKGQGAFTYYLLEGLDGKAADEGGNLTLQNVAKYVQRQMRVWGIQENKTQIPSLETKGAAEIVLGRVSRTTPEPKPNDPKPGGKVNPKDTNAYLDIVTNPVGATVYVEGQPLAGVKTPYRYVQEMGLNRQVEIEVGVRMPGYKDAVRSVMLERGNVTTLTLTLEAVTPRPEPKKPTEPEKKTNSQTKVNPKDGAEMILIPAGEFMMGSNDYDEEKPIHKVNLDGYYVYKNVVTVKQYKQFCAEKGHSMPSAPDFNPNWSKEDHPIVSVTYNDTLAYCEWAGVKLPTEAQWEKAARGTDGRKFPWGETFDRNKLWCSKSKFGDAGGTKPVGNFALNSYGLYDMAGNVWQWCSDWYDKDFYGSRSATEKNPKNQSVGEKKSRVVRGGSWCSYGAVSFRCANRNNNAPDNGIFNVGFRCASKLAQE